MDLRNKLAEAYSKDMQTRRTNADLSAFRAGWDACKNSEDKKNDVCVYGVNDARSPLTMQEIKVLALIHGIGGGGAMTIASASRVLGKSPTRVYNILNVALKKVSVATAGSFDNYLINRRKRLTLSSEQNKN